MEHLQAATTTEVASANEPTRAKPPAGTKTAIASEARPHPRARRAGERLILFAHGAGAPSTSDWMSGWAERLAAFGEVVRFDYPYMAKGKKRPDPHDVLLASHRRELREARRGRRGPVVLVGKSLGSRIGCHLALEEQVAALVCLGYPLQSPAGKLRDEVLLALKTPILFVQGTRDRLCPLDKLEEVRRAMTAPSELYVVEDGDHSLLARKTWLKQRGLTQAGVDDGISRAIEAFFDKHAG